MHDPVGVELTATATQKTTRARHWLILAAVVLLVAVPIRLCVAVRAEMISRDGAVFIWYAQKLATAPLEEMRAQRHHPLYPAMVLTAHAGMQAFSWLLPAPAWWSDPVSGWQFAAMSVTLLGGILAVLGVYAVARGLFNPAIALVAAALTATAAEFCQLSGDALSDMPHLAMYLFSLACCIRGLQRRSPAWLLAGGALSGLAYLVRPEGAEIALAAAALVAAQRHWPIRQRAIAVMAVVLGAGAIASPYVLITGKAVQKKPIQQFLPWATSLGAPSPRSGGGEAMINPRIGRAYRATSSLPHPPSADGPPALNLSATSASSAASPPRLAGTSISVELARAIGLILEKYVRCLRVTFLLPAIAWLALRRRRPADPVAGMLVAGIIMLHVAVALLLITRFDYWELFSLRHVLVLAALTLPFSAAGIVAIVEAVPASRRTVVAILLTAMLIGPTLPWMLERRFADEVYLRRTGEWIRAQAGPSQRILTTRHRVAFYAAGVHVWSPLDADVAAIIAEARFQRPDWLVFDERRLLKADAGFFQQLHAAVLPSERLELAHEEPSPAGTHAARALIYRYTTKAGKR